MNTPPTQPDFAVCPPTETGSATVGGALRRLLLWLLCGVAIVAAMTTLSVLVSTIYPGGTNTMEEKAAIALDTPWWWVRMICYMSAAVVFILGMLLLPKALPQALTGRRLVVVIFLLAMAMRAPLFFIPAKNGFDYNNYLWDGAMSGHLQNPYQYKYSEIRNEGKGNTTVRGLVEKQGSSLLAPRAYTGKEILGRTNHQGMQSAYPPVAQFFFGLAHRITPFNVTGLRLLLLGMDLLTALLVLSLIRKAAMPLAALSAYLWNPLLLFETYVDCHQELVTVAIIVLAVWLLSRKRFVSFAATAALAMAAKVWPAFIMIYLIRPAWKNKKILIIALAVFAVLGAGIMAPYYLELRNNKTLAWYAANSHDMQGLHILLDKANEKIVQWLGLHETNDRIARNMGYAIWFIVLAWSAFRRWDNPYQFCFRLGIAMLIFWLQAATIYPWYYQTVIPFAAITLRPSLLAWSLLMPLGQMVLADQTFNMFPVEDIIVWGVHLPVWILLGLELLGWPRRPAQALTPAAA